MNNENTPVMDNSSEQIPPQHAIKLFDPSSGAGDFPVLKAFQEYLENEQAKSRKRMLGLSIFFILLLVVVVVTFTLIMTTVINRNQTLSDRLMDIALRERQPVTPPVVNVQQPVPQPVSQANPTDAMKPMLDRLEKLATAIAEKQKAAPVPPATTPEQAKIVAETQAQLMQQAELKRQQDAVKAEIAKLKEEQEKLRQEQVEQHRRRLYPEYYAQQDARAAEVAARAAQPTRTVPAVQPTVQPEPTPKKGAVNPLPANHQAVAPATSPSPRPVHEQPKDNKLVLKDDFKTVDVDSQKPLTFFNGAEDEDLKNLIQQTKAKQAPTKPNVSPRPAPVAPAAPATNGRAASSGAKPAVSSNVKTETLKVTTANSNSIPWILEAPVTSPRK